MSTVDHASQNQYVHGQQSRPTRNLALKASDSETGHVFSEQLSSLPLVTSITLVSASDNVVFPVGSDSDASPCFTTLRESPAEETLSGDRLPQAATMASPEVRTPSKPMALLPSSEKENAAKDPNGLSAISSSSMGVRGTSGSASHTVVGEESARREVGKVFRKWQHNEHERRRKDKISAGILRLGELLPDRDPRRMSKVEIISRACDYIIYLRDLNEKIVANNIPEAQAKMLTDMRKQISGLELVNSSYMRLLQKLGISLCSEPTAVASAVECASAKRQSSSLPGGGSVTSVTAGVVPSAAATATALLTAAAPPVSLAKTATQSATEITSVTSTTVPAIAPAPAITLKAAENSAMHALALGARALVPAAPSTSQQTSTVTSLNGVNCQLISASAGPLVQLGCGPTAAGPIVMINDQATTAAAAAVLPQAPLLLQAGAPATAPAAAAAPTQQFIINGPGGARIVNAVSAPTGDILLSAPTAQELLISASGAPGDAAGKTITIGTGSTAPAVVGNLAGVAPQILQIGSAGTFILPSGTAGSGSLLPLVSHATTPTFSFASMAQSTSANTSLLQAAVAAVAASTQSQPNKTIVNLNNSNPITPLQPVASKTGAVVISGPKVASKSTENQQSPSSVVTSNGQSGEKGVTSEIVERPTSLKRPASTPATGFSGMFEKKAKATSKHENGSGSELECHVVEKDDNRHETNANDLLAQATESIFDVPSAAASPMVSPPSPLDVSASPSNSANSSAMPTGCASQQNASSSALRVELPKKPLSAAVEKQGSFSSTAADLNEASISLDQSETSVRSSPSESASDLQQSNSTSQTNVSKHVSSQEILLREQDQPIENASLPNRTYTKSDESLSDDVPVAALPSTAFKPSCHPCNVADAKSGSSQVVSSDQHLNTKNLLSESANVNARNPSATAEPEHSKLSAKLATEQASCDAQGSINRSEPATGSSGLNISKQNVSPESNPTSKSLECTNFTEDAAPVINKTVPSKAVETESSGKSDSSISSGSQSSAAQRGQRLPSAPAALSCTPTSQASSCGSSVSPTTACISVLDSRGVSGSVYNSLNQSGVSEGKNTPPSKDNNGSSASVFDNGSSTVPTCSSPAEASRTSSSSGYSTFGPTMRLATDAAKLTRKDGGACALSEKKNSENNNQVAAKQSQAPKTIAQVLRAEAEANRASNAVSRTSPSTSITTASATVASSRSTFHSNSALTVPLIAATRSDNAVKTYVSSAASPTNTLTSLAASSSFNPTANYCPALPPPIHSSLPGMVSVPSVHRTTVDSCNFARLPPLPPPSLGINLAYSSHASSQQYSHAPITDTIAPTALPALGSTSHISPHVNLPSTPAAISNTDSPTKSSSANSNNKEPSAPPRRELIQSKSSCSGSGASRVTRATEASPSATCANQKGSVTESNKNTMKKTASSNTRSPRRDISSPNGTNTRRSPEKSSQQNNRSSSLNNSNASVSQQPVASRPSSRENRSQNPQRHHQTTSQRQDQTQLQSSHGTQEARQPTGGQAQQQQFCNYSAESLIGSPVPQFLPLRGHGIGGNSSSGHLNSSYSAENLLQSDASGQLGISLSGGCQPQISQSLSLPTYLPPVGSIGNTTASHNLPTASSCSIISSNETSSVKSSCASQGTSVVANTTSNAGSSRGNSASNGGYSSSHYTAQPSGLQATENRGKCVSASDSSATQVTQSSVASYAPYSVESFSTSGSATDTGTSGAYSGLHDIGNAFADPSGSSNSIHSGSTTVASSGMTNSNCISNNDYFSPSRGSTHYGNFSGSGTLLVNQAQSSVTATSSASQQYTSHSLIDTHQGVGHHVLSHHTHHSFQHPQPPSVVGLTATGSHAVAPGADFPPLGAPPAVNSLGLHDAATGHLSMNSFVPPPVTPVPPGFLPPPPPPAMVAPTLNTSNSTASTKNGNTSKNSKQSSNCTSSTNIFGISAPSFNHSHGSSGIAGTPTKGLPAVSSYGSTVVFGSYAGTAGGNSVVTTENTRSSAQSTAVTTTVTAASTKTSLTGGVGCTPSSKAAAQKTRSSQSLDSYPMPSGNPLDRTSSGSGGTPASAPLGYFDFNMASSSASSSCNGSGYGGGGSNVSPFPSSSNVKNGLGGSGGVTTPTMQNHHHHHPHRMWSSHMTAAAMSAGSSADPGYSSSYLFPPPPPPPTGHASSHASSSAVAASHTYHQHSPMAPASSSAIHSAGSAHPMISPTSSLMTGTNTSSTNFNLSSIIPDIGNCASSSSGSNGTGQAIVGFGPPSMPLSVAGGCQDGSTLYGRGPAPPLHTNAFDGILASPCAPNNSGHVRHSFQHGASAPPMPRSSTGFGLFD